MYISFVTRLPLVIISFNLVLLMLCYVLLYRAWVLCNSPASNQDICLILYRVKHGKTTVQTAPVHIAEPFQQRICLHDRCFAQNSGFLQHPPTNEGELVFGFPEAKCLHVPSKEELMPHMSQVLLATDVAGRGIDVKESVKMWFANARG